MLAALRTVNWKILLWPRMIAALPLIILGIAHFTPDGSAHFRKILEAAQVPSPEINAIAAPIAEVLGGVLLLLGLLGRLGGLLGVGTMAPAIYATLKIQEMAMNPDLLPAGVSEVPFVPPLPVPIVVLVCSFIILVFGSGRFSMDYTLTRPHIIERH